jgi:2-methylisocitrate lyase-like PEP mutase family enzyme
VGLGRADGRHAVSRDEAIANGALIARVTGLPVNGDLEDGFGASPDDCVATVEAAIAGGLAGLGIEDTTADPDRPIHDFDAAVARVRAAAVAARGRIWLTGRTDLLLQGSDDLDAVVRRLVAFAEVGADMVYAPALSRIEDVRRVVAAVAPVPVNVLGWATLTIPQLEEAGVKRMSLGASTYLATMGGLVDVAAKLAAGDRVAAAANVAAGAAFVRELG